MTFALPNQRAAGRPDCPSGWYCFYDNNNYGYPRGKLSDCGWQDLGRYGWSDRIQSVHHNARATVSFINHYDAGNPANGHNLDREVFTVQPGSAWATVPAPNVADHANHICLLP